MRNPFGVVTRLFQRNSGHAVIAELHKALSQPLFVHPALGQAIIESYLRADPQMLSGYAKKSIDETAVQSRDIAILDISGALVARETPGVCGSGPLSYEEIGYEFDQLMANPMVHTIIGRFDTPGGMAAQNADLSDKIYAARGQGKRLIAMVDDMAFSAGYGLASAFDEIWVTRTGSVGSVGVVSYHENYSEMLKSAGVSIEYLYYGDRKIDGNPAQALSDPARQRFMAEIQRLGDMFVSTIARNRGLTFQQVRDTQATTFHGEEAVKAGFADKVGTFEQLLASLNAQQNSRNGGTQQKQQGHLSINAELAQMAANLRMDTPSKSTQPAANADTQTATGDDASATEGETVETSADEQPGDNGAAGTEQAAAASLTDADLVATAARVAQIYEAQVRAACAAAKVPEAAADYIAAKTDIATVRNELMRMLAAGEQVIINTAPEQRESAQTDSKPLAASIYEQRRKQLNQR